MAFADDLRGIPPAEQIARLQAAALAAGGELDESQVSQALSLYAVTGTDEPPETACRAAWQRAGPAGHRSTRQMLTAARQTQTRSTHFLRWRPDLPAHGPEQSEAG